MEMSEKIRHTLHSIFIRIETSIMFLYAKIIFESTILDPYRNECTFNFQEERKIPGDIQTYKLEKTNNSKAKFNKKNTKRQTIVFQLSQNTPNIKTSMVFNIIRPFSFSKF